MKQSLKLRSSKRNGERGSVLAVSALGMLAFILATGLAVDISHLYLVKTELQNAADAAAIAGASSLDSHSSGVAEATKRAVEAMNKYDFNKTGISIPPDNVTFAVNLAGPYMSKAAAEAAPAKIRFVKVATAASPTTIFFASIVLGAEQSLAAGAVAGMSIPINSFCDWIPLSVIDYDIPMAPGTLYTIRSKSPTKSVSPGNYQALAVRGQGASDLEIGLASGVDDCRGPGATYLISTKPGVNAGPVRFGINTRFDEYSNQLDPTNQPPDTNVKEGITYDDYRDAQKQILDGKTPSSNLYQPSRNPGVTGRRIVVIPIIKKEEFDEGRNTVRFDRFGLFFLRTKIGNGNGGEIQAEYIDDTMVLGRGGIDPANGPGDPLMRIPVLYK